MPKRTEHPYLFFNARELAELRKRLDKPPLRGRWRVLLKNAKACLSKPPYGLPNVRWSLGLCGLTAFAYAVTGKKAFGERAKREALHLLRQKAWHVEHGYNHGADLPTSEAAMACAFVYDWCRDRFSDAEARDFRSALLARSTRVYLRSVHEYRDWWTDNPVTNWCGVCHGGNGLAALAMYHEEPLARRAAHDAREHLSVFLRHVNGIDGDGHEGVMYWLYGMSFGHIFWHAASRLFGSDGGLYANIARKRSGYWLAYLLGPDGLYANFNNMNEETFSGYRSREMERGPQATLCALFERHSPGGDQLLRWAADTGGSAFYYRGSDPLWFLWRSKRGEVRKQPPLADAVLFRTSGHAVLKSKDFWVAFNGGWTSNASHANRDLGSFILVWQGTRLIHDPGYGPASTAQHSTLTCGKQEQIHGAAGRFLRFGSGKNFQVFSCDLSAAYPGWIKTFVRHGVVVSGRYLVLLDDVEQAGPSRRELELRFQTRGAIALRPELRRATIRSGPAALHILAAAPGDSVVGQGRDAIEFARVQPYVRRMRETFVTVLYPASAKGAAPATYFSVAGKRGTLCVTHPGGAKDEVEFEQVRGHWALASVNGVSARKLPSGERQTVFRV